MRRSTHPLGKDDLLVLSVIGDGVDGNGIPGESSYIPVKRRNEGSPEHNADEQKEPKPDTVEAWGRSEDNPIGGWYGLKKNFRGRFAMYIPPLMENLGLAEVEHAARNNRMRHKGK